MKKNSKKFLFGMLLSVSLIMLSCASSEVTKTENSKKSNQGKDPRVKVSKHLELPDTSSSIVTEPQEMNESLTSVELSRIMGNGVNLGNTMEAYRAGGVGTNREATFYEQIWGQPVTTEQMIKGYKAAGFDTLRIPIAWTNVMDYDNGNYIIGQSYLDRIETIVNWALDAGLYVIINDHWDGGWWGMFGSYTPEIQESAMELYVAMWTQIGNRFKNYSYKLIFEGGNEEVGDRLNDDNSCWDSGSLTEEDCYKMAAKINQTFVDTIRSLGGNNESRFLLIPGYNTDIRHTCDSRWKMPVDSVSNRLLVSVHYYDPSPLCIGGGDEWGSKQDIIDMNDALKMLSKFPSAGYGVIIGEYGVLPVDGKMKSATMLYHSCFLDYCDFYGYCPVLWDTGNACFYNKTKAQLSNNEIAELYMAHSFEKEKDHKVETVKSAAQKRVAARVSEAPESLSGNTLEGRKDIAVAYLMYADQNWGVNYSVGDQYKPSSKAKGLEATDVGITEPGEYTIGLNFANMNDKGTAKSSGFSFCAVGIANGEILHPDWVVDIKAIIVNGKEVSLTKRNFTCSDDGKCTRSNIVNDWVTEARGRTKDGSLDNCGATIIEKSSLVFQSMKTLEVVFYYGPAD